MDDFLKDRPVVDPTPDAPAAAETATAPEPEAAPSPFGQLDRTVPPSAGNSSQSSTEAVVAQTLSADGGAKVETVVENGRVVRIIVTCSCGKATEVACNY